MLVARYWSVSRINKKKSEKGIDRLRENLLILSSGCLGGLLPWLAFDLVR